MQKMPLAPLDKHVRGATHTHIQHTQHTQTASNKLKMQHTAHNNTPIYIRLIEGSDTPQVVRPRHTGHLRAAHGACNNKLAHARHLWRVRLVRDLHVERLLCADCFGRLDAKRRIVNGESERVRRRKHVLKRNRRCRSRLDREGALGLGRHAVSKQRARVLAARWGRQVQRRACVAQLGRLVCDVHAHFNPCGARVGGCCDRLVDRKVEAVDAARVLGLGLCKAEETECLHLARTEANLELHAPLWTRRRGDKMEIVLVNAQLGRREEKLSGLVADAKGKVLDRDLSLRCRGKDDVVRDYDVR
eukprot:Opistho-2@25313